MITFAIDDEQEVKLNIWRNHIRTDPRVINKHEKFIFYKVGQETICEVTRGPHKIDLVGGDEW
jgi:hypothetical protein